jgi:hypothetical protein
MPKEEMVTITLLGDPEEHKAPQRFQVDGKDYFVEFGVPTKVIPEVAESAKRAGLIK